MKKHTIKIIFSLKSDREGSNIYKPHFHGKETMAHKTIITQWIHPEIIDFLSAYTHVVANQTREPMTRARLLELAQDAQAIMVFMPDCIDDTFLNECPNLKIVSAALKGYDNFDVAACTNRGIWFTRVPNLLTIPTAELAVGLLITVSRNIIPGHALVKSGRFKGWRPALYGRGLADSTVGIIGFGKVGKAIASRLYGFGPTMICCDPQADATLEYPGMGIEPVDLNTLLSRSDFIILAIPLLQGTRHLINRDRLGFVKKSAYMINIGRGSCVDESAVAQALENDQLAGYAADVFEFEDWARPDRPHGIDSRLLASEKTVFTPHLGSAVDRIRYQIAMQAALNIKDVLLGDSPPGAVNDPTVFFPRTGSAVV